jgi:ABC-type Na+ transport system ATPase subunit NatA
MSDWLSNGYLGLIDFIERSVMIKLRSEFSRVFNHWFNMLVPESFEAQLDENFTPVILQSGIEMEYSFLSGGERTAVALAYRLALNQTINSILSQIKTRDIVILDEPTDGFSESQLDKMRDIFSQLKVKDKSPFISNVWQYLWNINDNPLKSMPSFLTEYINPTVFPLLSELQSELKKETLYF